MEKKTKKYGSILVLDSGGNYVSIAQYFTEFFSDVYYYCPNYAGTPTLNKSMIGEGIDGVTVVEQWKYKWNDYKAQDGGYDFDKIDTFFFADCYAGDDQMLLVKKLGKNVWGSRKSEELELLRYETKQKMKKIGLPVTPTKLCKSYKELYEFLQKENKPKFIKLSWFRGIMESCKFENMFDSIHILDNLKKSLEECYAAKGKNAMELMAETPIESDIEIGIDSFNIDGKFPDTLMYGLEIKNKAYVSTYTTFEKLPAQLKYTTKGLAKLIAEYGENGCRSHVSTEVRIDKKTGEGHLIDITMRMPSPPSEGQQIWIENLAEIIYEGARGKVVEPIFKDKYMVQVAIYSGIKDAPQEITIPKEIQPYVKLMNYCKTADDKFGIIPELVTPCDPTVEIGYIAFYGVTIEKCFDKIKEISEKIEGECLTFMFDAKEDVMKEIDIVRKTLKILF
jgi:hypothetical protein